MRESAPFPTQENQEKTVKIRKEHDTRMKKQKSGKLYHLVPLDIKR